jgi:hypothetical protein
LSLTIAANGVYLEHFCAIDLGRGGAARNYHEDAYLGITDSEAATSSLITPGFTE